MVNLTIIYSLIGTIVAVLTIYSIFLGLIIKTKNSSIESLKIQKEHLQQQIIDLKEITPEILVEKLSKRIESYKKELELTTIEAESQKEILNKKENEIKEIFDKLSSYEDQINKAKELMSNSFCPYCNSKIISTMFDGGNVNDHIDVDYLCVEYECGLKTVNGAVVSKCQFKK